MEFKSNLDYKELKDFEMVGLTIKYKKDEIKGFIRKLPINLELRPDRYVYHIELTIKDRKLAHKLAELDDIYVDNIKYYRAKIEMPPRAVDDEYLLYIDYYSYDTYNYRRDRIWK